MTKQVTVQELRDLRGQGYTNAEIAIRIGCSSRTVWKYIGPQPKDLSKTRQATNKAYNVRIIQDLPTPTPEPEPEPEQEQIKIDKDGNLVISLSQLKELLK